LHKGGLCIEIVFTRWSLIKCFTLLYMCIKILPKSVNYTDYSLCYQRTYLPKSVIYICCRFLCMEYAVGFCAWKTMQKSYHGGACSVTSVTCLMGHIFIPWFPVSLLTLLVLLTATLSRSQIIIAISTVECMKNFTFRTVLRFVLRCVVYGSKIAIIYAL